MSKTVECYNSPEITGPVTGGTTEPEPPPVDPEVPPSPPNQEENNSGGYIEVNGGTLSYHAGVPTFQDLKDQADAMKPPNDTEIIKVPQGIYYDESVQRYYYVTEDTITQKYNCGSMAQIKNYTNNWTKVLALNDQLITEDDIIGGDHFGSSCRRAVSIVLAVNITYASAPAADGRASILKIIITGNRSIIPTSEQGAVSKLALGTPKNREAGPMP